MKILYSKTFDHTSPDGFREMMPVFFWCRMEEVILLVACSAPSLKSTVEHAFKKLGFRSFRYKVRELNSLHSFANLPTQNWHDVENQQEREGKFCSGIKVAETELEARG